MSDAKAGKTQPRQVFDSVEEAKRHPVSRKGWSLCQVSSPGGRVRYMWSNGWHSALLRVAQADGYAGAELTKVPTRERVEGMLAMLPEADRKLVLAKYKAKK
jgi:hypothetical protein